MPPDLQNPPSQPPESAMLAGMSVPNPASDSVSATLATGLASPPWTGGFPNIPDSSVPGLAALQEPAHWVYDFDPGTGQSRATFNGEVTFTSGGSSTAGVTAFNTRTGNVTLTTADITGAGGAPSNNPTFVGVPNAATAAPGTSSTQLATCQFVQQAITAAAGVVSFNGRTGAVVLTASDVTSAGGAPTVSPALTGVPTAPTAATTDNGSTIATTAFVNNWAAQNTVLSFNGRRGAVTLSLSDITSAGGAPIASPNFTGVPAGPTAAPGTATTQLASCAFVTNAVAAATSGVSSWNGRSGAVTLQLADVEAVGGAPLVSPSLTGTPLCPTATAGTNTTQIASCAFVETAITNMAPVVSSFNGRTGAVTLQLADVTAVGGAPLAAPVFTGNAAAPTPTAGDNSTRLATTAFVVTALAPYATTASVNAALVPYATTASVNATFLPLAGGTMTGAINSPTSGNFGNSTIGGVQLAANSVNASSGNVSAQDLVATAAMWQGTATPRGNTASFQQMVCEGQATIEGQATFTGAISSSAVVLNTFQGDLQCKDSFPLAHNTGSCGSGSLAWNLVAGFTVSQLSDADLKTDFDDLPECLEIVEAITPQRYRWKDGPDTERVQWGFVAQDVGNVMEAAGYEFGGYRPAEGDANAMLEPFQMVAVLWKAVQELSQRVVDLENALVAK